MTDPGSLLPIAVEAVARGAAIVRDRAPGARTAKGERDFATEVDHAVERHVRQFLADVTPDVGLVGEEDGGRATAGLWWALDPVDGTVNFAHGSPLCAVSLGLVAGDRPVLGAIELPLLGARYSAADGHGAQRDGAPIRTSPATQLADAVVAIGDYAVGHGADEANRDRLEVTARLAARVLRVRMLGSAAIDLVWLAEGRLHASVTLCNLPWDMAAGVVIAREAGAAVTDRRGRPHTTRSAETVAVSPGLVGPVLELLTPRDVPPRDEPAPRSR